MVGFENYGKWCATRVRQVVSLVYSSVVKGSHFIFGVPVEPWFWREIFRLQMLTYMPGYSVVYLRVCVDICMHGWMNPGGVLMHICIYSL